MPEALPEEIFRRLCNELSFLAKAYNKMKLLLKKEEERVDGGGE